MEEIQFNHTLPIQLRFNDVDKFGHVNNTVYFSFYDLGKTEYFRFRMPGCRLGKGWYRCRPYWSKLPRTDLWFGPYRRANCRHWDRNQKLPPRPTGHWYGNPRSKMRMYLRHGSLRPRQTRVQATGRKMDWSNLQIWGKRFEEKEIKSYICQLS